MKINFKRLLLPSLLCFVLLMVLFNINNITNSFAKVLEKKPTIVINDANKYTKDYSFEFVKLNNNFIPYSYQDLLNIIYSTLNNGWETFTFYCPAEYTDCITDIKKITNDEILLTNINNFIHPFNSFKNIKTSYDNSGEITFRLTKLYSQEQIDELNKAVDNIINKNILDEMTLEEKIRVIHDYIINNTVYDTEAVEELQNHSVINTAIGSLINGKALCSGYSDAMALFLYKFRIPNYKIASKTHVWNAVYINDEWKHLDLTWDDPITEDGQNILIHNFFLIDTESLHKEDMEYHTFDYIVYREFIN